MIDIEQEIRLIIYKLRNLVYYRSIDTRINVNYLLPLQLIKKRGYRVIREYQGNTEEYDYKLLLRITSELSKCIMKEENTDLIYSQMELLLREYGKI